MKTVRQLLKEGEQLKAKWDAWMKRATLPEADLVELRQWQAEKKQRQEDHDAFMARTTTLADNQPMYTKARADRETRLKHRQKATQRELEHHIKHSGTTIALG